MACRTGNMSAFFPIQSPLPVWEGNSGMSERMVHFPPKSDYQMTVICMSASSQTCAQEDLVEGLGLTWVGMHLPWKSQLV